RQVANRRVGRTRGLGALGARRDAMRMERAPGTFRGRGACGGGGRDRRGADLGGGRGGLVLAPRAAAGGGNRAARASASPGYGPGASRGVIRAWFRRRAGGTPLDRERREMGLNWAEHTVEIAAPIETCFDAITDYETFASWQSAVVDTEVLDWDAKGRGKRVRLFVDAKVRKVDYTLDYSYDEPTRIEWDFVEGNGINGADGHYLFEDLGNDRTRATYKLGLEVGIPLPGPVARRAHKTALKGSVEALKREAERRAASSASARDDDPSRQRERELAEQVG